jgi:predicted dehydrogenase
VNGRVGIGLLGCGRIGMAHARALETLAAARLIGVADPEQDRASAAAERYGALVFESPEDLVACGQIDAVIVAVPTHLHAALTVQAASAGKHVLCEKPMAMTVEECDNMLSASAARGILLMVGHDLRFSAHYRGAHAAIQSGRIGRPLSLYAERLSGASATTLGAWIRQAGLGSGAFDALVHDLDVALWFLGPARAAGAHGTRGPGGTWDHIQALVLHSTGCSSMFEASLSVPATFPFASGLRVVGDEGTLVRRFVGGRTFQDPGTDTGLMLYRHGDAPAMLTPPDPNNQASLRRELATFIAAVQTGAPPPEANPETGRAALLLATNIAALLQD